jgi:hypothetical protein
MKVKFYHGTSTTLDFYDLQPSVVSGVLREERSRNLDVVFLTRSKVSAEFYAKKACAKFGGEPVVYLAIPQGDYIEFGNNEVMCDWATLVEVV